VCKPTSLISVLWSYQTSAQHPLPVRGWEGVSVLKKKKAPTNHNPHPPNSFLTSQWIYLVQFSIKHFFTLQYLHNRFIFSQELPMKRDLFVFSFLPQNFRILDSRKAAACKQHFCPLSSIEESHAPTGPGSGKLLTQTTTSPKTGKFPFQCHCNLILHLGCLLQQTQHQCYSYMY